MKDPNVSDKQMELPLEPPRSELKGTSECGYSFTFRYEGPFNANWYLDLVNLPKDK